MQAFTSGQTTLPDALGDHSIEGRLLNWVGYISGKHGHGDLLALMNPLVEYARQTTPLPPGGQYQFHRLRSEASLVAQELTQRSYYSHGSFRESQSELNAGLAALACERFRREQGRWPTALKDLVPGYLRSVPVDRVDGKPIRYRRLAHGAVVYSIGPDGTDDGGKIFRQFANPLGLTQWGSDRGVQLWDPKRRRQEPFKQKSDLNP